MGKLTASVFHYGRLLAFAIASMAMIFAGEATAAEEIRIGGSGNALGIMRPLGDAFSKQNPDIKITVLPSLGSSGAIKAVNKGAIDIGLTSRPLTEEEGKLGMIAVEYARTLLVFAVSTGSPVTSVTLAQLADIYSGKTASWPDGTQIRPVVRQAGDDDARAIMQMSAAFDKAWSAAERRPGLPFATSDQETADKTETIPGALSTTTLLQIKSENRQLRALTLDGVEPTVSNGKSGKYPHVKRLWFATRSDTSAAARRFIAFVQSPLGREILIRADSWIP